jgi:serine/threonine-protein kinase
MEIAVNRFRREVQTMAQLRHPNILNIFDYGTHLKTEENKSQYEDALEYIVMEYIPGNSFRFTMSEEGLDDEPGLYCDWIKTYFSPVLDGVEAMHLRNIFHRDLKPENIFMDGDIPKIADFGLARSQKLKAVSNSMDMQGTLSYMAPEQFSEFRYADQTADIYALGKILFEAFDGKLDNKTLPMKAVSIEKKADMNIPFLKEMNRIIQKATAEDKSERFQTVAELRSDLVNAIKLEKIPEEKQSLQSRTATFVQKNDKAVWVGIVLVLISVIAMAAWHILNRPDRIPSLVTEKKAIDPQKAGLVLPDNNADLKDHAIATDGSRMILIRQADDSVKSEESAQEIFYMDEEPISNFLYVEFLNTIKDQVRVDKGVVKHNGNILLYIGAGEREEDHILYRHNRFHLKDQEIGSRPVTRVSYHGARAYAAYYARSLLTESEWKYAYAKLHRQYLKNHTNTSEPQEVFTMHHSLPLEQFPPEPGRFPGEMGRDIKEWVQVKNDEISENVSRERFLPGAIEAKDIEKEVKPALLQRWEGLPNVGFRTKVQIQ